MFFVLDSHPGPPAVSTDIMGLVALFVNAGAFQELRDVGLYSRAFQTFKPITSASTHTHF